MSQTAFASPLHGDYGVGHIDGWFRPTHPPAIQPAISNLSSDHRNKGLGYKMYEALLTHAKHHLHATHVEGLDHSADAHRVHGALARTHGMEYVAEKQRSTPNPVGKDVSFDFGNYSYMIKAEGDPLLNARAVTDRFGAWHRSDMQARGHNPEWGPDCQHVSTSVAIALQQLGHKVSVVGGTALGSDAGKYDEPDTHYWLKVDGQHFDPKEHLLTRTDPTFKYTSRNATFQMSPEEAAHESVEDAFEPIQHMIKAEDPEFQKWFEGSKMVGADAQPLRLYHGTRSASMIGTHGLRPSGGGEFGPGIYLSADPGTAHFYAQHGGSGPDAPAIVPVHAALKNPFRVSKTDWIKMTQRSTPRTVQKRLQAKGHDGIIGVGLNGHDEQVVVWHPEQVRSSILKKGEEDAPLKPKKPPKAPKPERAPDLVVIHNLSGANLLHAHKLGGLAAPSLAITHKDAPLEGFGEVSLVAHPDLADPAKVPCYESDIYSPSPPSCAVPRPHEGDGQAQEVAVPVREEVQLVRWRHRR